MVGGSGGGGGPGGGARWSSALLLLAPLRMISRGKEKVSFHGTLFFLGIGAGFMLAELLFVYLGTFFMGDPVVSLTLTLAATLVSSGLGGLWAGRRNPILLRASLAAAPLVLSLTAGRPHGCSRPTCSRCPRRCAASCCSWRSRFPVFSWGCPFPWACATSRRAPWRSHTPGPPTGAPRCWLPSSARKSPSARASHGSSPPPRQWLTASLSWRFTTPR
ncbi:MAG: hypothetical protein MZV70_28865 [Desulfobacterales bacterium]|nr:hypothetical protein [Desulfobacterales bacterium]